MRLSRAGLLLAGLSAYPLLALLLAQRSGLGLLHGFFLAGLLELLPVLALGQVMLARDVEIDRIPAYLHSGATILLLGILSLVMGRRLGGPEALGLKTPFSASDLLWTCALSIAGLGTLLAFRCLRRALGRKEPRLVRDLLPVTAKERGLFAGLSLCAGFGEEVAYRGYAMTALLLISGSAALALIVTSATFGVLHAYQGPIGVVRTGVVGLIMGAALLHTGNLWPPIVAHALIDLIAGLVVRERLLS